MVTNKVVALNLGPVTSYGLAKSKGFPGTEEAWVQKLMNSAVESEVAAIDDKVEALDNKVDEAVETLNTTIETEVGAVDAKADGIAEDLTELTAEVALKMNTTTANAHFTPKPETDGDQGDALRNNGDGTTSWAPIGLPTDEQTADAITAWLTAHPEATTTVEDGAITRAKLDTDLQNKTDLSANALASAFVAATANAAGAHVTYGGKLYLLPNGHEADVTWANTTKTEVTLGGEVRDLKSAIHNDEITLLTEPMYLRKGYIDASGIWKSVTSTTMGHRIYPVKPGDRVVITANADKGCNIRVLTSDALPVADASAPNSTDPAWATSPQITKGTTWTGTMPSDAKYLYINTQYTDAALPASCQINGRDILHSVWDNVSNSIASVNNTITNSIASVNSVVRKKITDNTENYYTTLDKDSFAVGQLSSTGAYDSSKTTRICTPEIQIAENDLIVRPLGSYAIVADLFTDGEKTERLNSGAMKSIKISSGQQYKLMMRKSPEGSDAVTVDDLYDKIAVFNPIQYLEAINKTGDIEYVMADYGPVPKGIFYAGDPNDQYNLFDYDSTASDVITAFDTLVSNNTEYITKTDLGVCSDGTNHVYMYDFNPNQASVGGIYEQIPTVFVVCGQHGYEKASVFSLYYLAKHMISDTEHPVLSYLRNHCRIVCVPIANPSGFNTKTYKNSAGVNLNRNWDTDNWGEQTGADDPTSEDYAGTAPFDQPETLAISTAFNSIKDSVCLALDYHTNGKTVLTGLNEINVILFKNLYRPMWNAYKKATRYHIKNITAHFASEYSLTLADNQYCGGYVSGSTNAGTASSWFREQGKIACTFETFPGFPGGALYAPNVMKASEELIVNYIISVLNYIQ